MKRLMGPVGSRSPSRRRHQRRAFAAYRI